MDETPKEKAEIWRQLDAKVFPLLRETVAGSLAPEGTAFEYDADRWALLMDWLKSRAAIGLLRSLKEAEPPVTDVEQHAQWQYHYDKFRERALGFVKLHDSGILTSPEVVYFAIMLFRRMNHLSTDALAFLRVREPTVPALPPGPPTSNE